MERPKNSLLSASTDSLKMKHMKNPHAIHLKPIKRKRNMHRKKKLLPSEHKLGVEQLLEKTLTIATSVTEKNEPPRTLTLSEAKLQQLDKIKTAKSLDLDMYDSDGDESFLSSKHPTVVNRNYSSFISHAGSDDSVNSSQAPSALDSIGSDFTAAGSRVSTRMLLDEISKSHEHNLDTPSFVTPINDLSPVYLSWNKKAHHHPKINIIGMHQPIPLILAKADRRMRRQNKAKKEHKMQVEKRLQEINEVIEWKESRSERYAQMLQKHTAITFMLKIFTMTKYVAMLKERYLVNTASDKLWKSLLSSANKITKFYYRWYRTHVRGKLNRRIFEAFVRAKYVFGYYFRLYRKRRAVRKMITFLQEYRNHHKMNVVVHRFLASVRIVQRYVRRFFRMKQERVTSLIQLWNKYEHHYIKRKLEEKRLKMKATNDNRHHKGLLDSSIQLLSNKEHAKALLDMKHQNKNWQRIDGEMENLLLELRNTGVIQEETEEETISKLMASMEIKRPLLKSVVDRVYREFFKLQRSIIREKILMDSTFSERHASELLRGKLDNINRIVNSKFGHQVTSIRFQTFSFFLRWDKKWVYEKVREAHETLRTFHILKNKDEKSNSRGKI